MLINHKMLIDYFINSPYCCIFAKSCNFKNI